MAEISQTILHGKMEDMLKQIPDDSVDSCVTDPPYGIKFMGKKWDYQIPTVEQWQEVYRVLKPGAYLLSFGGTRTFHRIVCNIEDAGFEIRDTLMWLYGSGFPKSLDVSKAIDKHLVSPEREIIGYKRQGTKSMFDGGKPRSSSLPASLPASLYNGWGTALKPAFEPICLARKPFKGTVAENVLKYGTGAINVDGCRVETSDNLNGGAATQGITNASEGWDRPWRHNEKIREKKKIEKQNKVLHAETLGRFPANIIHDGSEEVVGMFPESNGQQGDLKDHKEERQSPNGIYGNMASALDFPKRNDSGSAARFFYTAKASQNERKGSKHPTVKPLALIRYLVRLITPMGGTAIDPWAGSGTTGQAALMEGMGFILIEKDDLSIEDIHRRLSGTQAGLKL